MSNTPSSKSVFDIDASRLRFPLSQHPRSSSRRTLGRCAAIVALTPALWLFATSASAADVVEFYNAGLDNYFITADPNEAAAIDAGGAGPGWARTGETFGSLGITPVCRFYGSINPGPNSHFYTASSAECSQLKAIQQTTPATQKRWNFESLDFFTSLPTAGTCPRNTSPVYRAYNNGFARGVDSNHRITTNPSAISQVVSRGWVDEGIVMCASNALFANQVAQANVQMKGIWAVSSFSGAWPEILRIDGNSFLDATTFSFPSGFEYGTWAWDPNDGHFYGGPVKDTNGAVGFSNRSATDLTQSIRVENGELVARRSDGTEAAHYKRLASVQTSVVGAWGNPQVFASNTLIFLPDSTFAFIDVTGGTGAKASCGPAGVEYGTYAWNATTGALSIPIVSADSDGCSGFQADAKIVPLTAKLSADGNTLTLTSSDSSFASVSYTRLTP